MRRKWYRPRATAVDGGLMAAYLVIFLIAGRLESSRAWLLACVAVAPIALFGWARAYGRTRKVKDTPTSRIDSAPQGYVELVGLAERPGYVVLSTPLQQEPCVWFEYTVEEKKGRNYKEVEYGISSEPIKLRDDTGTCLIDPEKATVIPRHKKSWTEGKFRYTESWLAPRESLYALGQFQTVSPGADGPRLREQTSALLTVWKRDQPTLITRFDRNRDGQIDLAEWEAAREAARAAVEKANHKRSQRPGLHRMHHPGDRRPFLLSARSPQSLERYLNRWSLFHLFMVVASVGGALVVMTRPALH